MAMGLHYIHSIPAVQTLHISEGGVIPAHTECPVLGWVGLGGGVGEKEDSITYHHWVKRREEEGRRGEGEEGRESRTGSCVHTDIHMGYIQTYTWGTYRHTHGVHTDIQMGYIQTYTWGTYRHTHGVHTDIHMGYIKTYTWGTTVHTANLH